MLEMGGEGRGGEEGRGEEMVRSLAGTFFLVFFFSFFFLLSSSSFLPFSSSFRYY